MHRIFARSIFTEPSAIHPINVVPLHHLLLILPAAHIAAVALNMICIDRPPTHRTQTCGTFTRRPQEEARGCVLLPAAACAHDVYAAR